MHHYKGRASLHLLYIVVGSTEGVETDTALMYSMIDEQMNKRMQANQ